MVGNGQTRVTHQRWIRHYQRGHGGRLGRQQTGKAVLDGEAMHRLDSQLLGGVDIDIRVRLAKALHLGGVHRQEAIANAELAEHGLHHGKGGGGGQTDFKALRLDKVECLQHTSLGLTFGEDQGVDPIQDALHHLFLAGAAPGAQPIPVGDQLIDAHAYGRFAIFHRVGMAQFGEDSHLGSLPKGFRVDQNTIHIEDHGS